MGVTSLPKTVTRQRRGCDLNPGPSAPKSSTLTTQLPSRRYGKAIRVKFDTDLLKAVAVVHRTQKQINRHLLMMMSAHNAPVFCTKVDGRDAQCDKLHGEGIRSN